MGVTYTGAKLQYASFSEWADTLNPEELQYFEVLKGKASEKRYYLPTNEEFAQFCELLQSIPEEDCYRRKETVDVYEDYVVWFLCGENEVLLKCLEDETVLYVGSTEMPEFAPEGKVLIIDSPELWNYIVDTVDEKGMLSKAQEDEQEKMEQCIYETTADLNHDGVEDSVRLMTYGKESSIWQDVDVNGAYVKVFLGTASGSYTIEPVYTSDFVASSHAENGTYILTEKDGKDYLVYSLMYEMQGNAGYTYSVMYFEGSEMVTVQTDEVNFYCDPYMKRFWTEGPRREEVLPQFKAGIEPWIENGTILVSFDVSTPDFIASYSYDRIPASSYYDMVWARSEADKIEEFEKGVGKEEWQQSLYWLSTNYSHTKDWIEEQLDTDYSKWYTEYDGSKLQRVDNCDYSPTSSVVWCDVPASCDTIYYRAGYGENVQDVLYKMIEKMVQARMEKTTIRGYVITDYVIPKQPIIQVSDDMWLVEYIKGYYSYEGSNMGTMEEMIDSGVEVTEDGLIPFFAQGSDDVFIHILIEKDGVYRLQRLQKMMN